jgi:hypothetical protein
VDVRYQIAVDVNLAAKTLTFEGGRPIEFLSASGVEIEAYSDGRETGRSNDWTLNRVTGEFSGIERFTVGGKAHDYYHHLKCEPVKTKF